MLALQQPANGSAIAPRQSQDYSNSSQQLEQQQQQQQHQQQQHQHQHQLQLQLQQQQQQQNTTPLIQIQSLNESRSGSFSMHLPGRQQLPAPLQQQQQHQRPIGPLDKPSSPWMVADFPPLPRTGQSVSSQGLLGAQSYSSVHPLQQQHIARPHSASGAFQQPQQGQMHLMQQQQQQQQQQHHHHHHHQLSHFQGIESAQGLNSHLNSPNATSLLESPAHPHAPHFQGLNQDSPLAFEHGGWNDPNKGTHPMDMFHIASPPHTPSGAMARSPSSYSAFGINANNIKRPPLWPMDRPPMLPFPRQTLTPSQSSKAANLQHIPCKFFKSGACTAGKNCLFSHSRDPPSENFVCKYFLKGNCKFGAKCSLSHSFLALDRKTSALLPGGGGGSLGRNNRLERRASSGAILNNPWALEPLSPPYTSALAQQQALQFSNNNNSTNNVEFTMGGRSPNQQGFLKPAMNRATSDGLRNAVFMTPPTEVGSGSGGHRSPYSDDDSASSDANGNERMAHPLSLLESRVRQHLAAPLPIRQRSLPDIFRLTPLSHDGPTMGATSPFHQPGNKGLFLSVSSCENETTPSSPLRLHSIPELHDLYNSHGQNGNHGNTSLPRRSSSAHFHNMIQDNDDDENDNAGDEFSDSDDSDQGFLPSSLNDLLTSHERQRRQSRQEDIDPRLTMLPSPASVSLRGDKDEDDARFSYGALSSHETSISPLAMLIPNNQMAPYPFQDPSSFEAAEDRSYQRQHSHYHHQHQHPHHHQQQQQLHAMSKDQGPHYKERNLTPDPFCPFPNDAEEVQFVMDDDVVTSTAGTGGIHTGSGGGGGSQSIISAQRDHDMRAGLFVDGATRTMAMELNRAVGSHTILQGGTQQQPQGTLTPVSLNSREDDSTEGAGVGGAVSSVAMDFSALTISASISSTELFDHPGSNVSAPTSYAGIARSQKGSF